MSYEELGLIIKRHRIEGGLTQKDLAVLSGISISVIQNIERGRNQVTIKRLESICKAFGISSWDILDF